MRARLCVASLATVLLLLPLSALSASADVASVAEPVVLSPESAASPGVATAQSTALASTRSGREIYTLFREGLAEPVCEPGTSARWRQHFGHVPAQLTTPRSNDVLPLFGYVVDALREVHLPTEYALIPFVESGYKPGARSASGPAGLWQFIAITARKHKIAIRPGYDGRLSPVESTQAAVRYLKTLHGMFAGDWRLTVMAYNAGEYRVFGALKRHGQRAMDARPEQLNSLSGITQAYVRKLHALSCLLAEADDREDWLRALDRPVPRLGSIELPPNADTLDAWAARQSLDAAMVKRLNPAFPDGRIARAERGLRVLVPAMAALQPANDALTQTPAATANIVPAPLFPADSAPGESATSAPRIHTVARGESAWTIARRYGIGLTQLLARNGLDARSVLRPGMALKLDDAPPESGGSAAAVAN